MTSKPRSSFAVSLERDRATVALSGEFDMAATFTIEPEVEKTLREPGLRAITLDLSGLTFIDSSGLGAIVELHAESRARGIALAIVPGPSHVQRVFETTGLSETLPISAG